MTEVFLRPPHLAFLPFPEIRFYNFIVVYLFLIFKLKSVNDNYARRLSGRLFFEWKQSLSYPRSAYQKSKQMSNSPQIIFYKKNPQ